MLAPVEPSIATGALPPDRRERSGRAGRFSGARLSPHRDQTIGSAGFARMAALPASRACRASAMCWKATAALVGVLLLISSRRGRPHHRQSVELVCRTRLARPFHPAGGDGDQAQACDLSQRLARAAHLAHPAGAGLPALQFRPQRRFSRAALRRRPCQRRRARRSAGARHCCWRIARWAASAWSARRTASFRPSSSSRAGWIGRQVRDDGIDLLPRTPRISAAAARRWAAISCSTARWA